MIVPRPRERRHEARPLARGREPRHRPDDPGREGGAPTHDEDQSTRRASRLRQDACGPLASRALPVEMTRKGAAPQGGRAFFFARRSSRLASLLHYCWLSQGPAHAPARHSRSQHRSTHMRRIAIALTAAALLVGAGLSAQAPNFTGKWTLVPDARRGAAGGGGKGGGVAAAWRRSAAGNARSRRTPRR